jgi:hypothetical protein
MRKLLMLAVMAFAALAVSAPSASATIHPDFPYGDTDPSHWFSVMPYDPDTSEWCGSSGCEFSASGGSGAFYRSSDGGGTILCQPELSGTVFDDGSVSVSQANFNGPDCQIVPAGFPWQGQICMSMVGDPWLKLRMGFAGHDNSVVPATVFGQFEWGSENWDESLTFNGDAMMWDAPGIYDFGATFNAVEVPYLWDDSGSCSWPELQA